MVKYYACMVAFRPTSTLSIKFVQLSATRRFRAVDHFVIWSGRTLKMSRRLRSVHVALVGFLVLV